MRLSFLICLFFAIAQLHFLSIVAASAASVSKATPRITHSEYDYIVVGGGSSGSVVAARLAQSSHAYSVALLEAGGRTQYALGGHDISTLAVQSGAYANRGAKQQRRNQATTFNQALDESSNADDNDDSASSASHRETRTKHAAHPHPSHGSTNSQQQQQQQQQQHDLALASRTEFQNLTLFDVPSMWSEAVVSGLHAAYEWPLIEKPTPTIARGLGGGSVVNAMVYVRGLQSDFDESWRVKGWSAREVAPFYRRSVRQMNPQLANTVSSSSSSSQQYKLAADEDASVFAGDGIDAQHAGNEIHLSSVSARDADPLARRFLASCQSIGLPLLADFNDQSSAQGEPHEGCGSYQFLIKRGERHSPAAALYGEGTPLAEQQKQHSEAKLHTAASASTFTQTTTHHSNSDNKNKQSSHSDRHASAGLHVEPYRQVTRILFGRRQTDGTVRELTIAQLHEFSQQRDVRQRQRQQQQQQQQQRQFSESDGSSNKKNRSASATSDDDHDAHSDNDELIAIGVESISVREMQRRTSRWTRHRSAAAHARAADPDAIQPQLRDNNNNNDASSDEASNSASTAAEPSVLPPETSRLLYATLRKHKHYARREVIISSGAIGTPKLLLLSGIGARDALESHQLPIVSDVPAVGRQLVDGAKIVMQWRMRQDAPPRSATEAQHNAAQRDRDAMKSDDIVDLTSPLEHFAPCLPLQLQDASNHYCQLMKQRYEAARLQAASSHPAADNDDDSTTTTLDSSLSYGVLGTPAFSVGSFLKSSPLLRRPNLQLTLHAWNLLSRSFAHAGRESIVNSTLAAAEHARESQVDGGDSTAQSSNRQSTELSGIATIEVAANDPVSRGRVELRSADPLAAPIVDVNYLSEKADIDVLLLAIQQVRRLVSSWPLNETLVEELTPGMQLSEAQLRDFILCGAQAWRQSRCDSDQRVLNHLAGSCRMGNVDEDDDESTLTSPDIVVNPELQVLGVQSLRCADASIIVHLPSGNTHASCLMIAERAAHMILKDATSGRSTAHRLVVAPDSPSEEEIEHQARDEWRHNRNARDASMTRRMWRSMRNAMHILSFSLVAAFMSAITFLIACGVLICCVQQWRRTANLSASVAAGAAERQPLLQGASQLGGYTYSHPQSDPRTRAMMTDRTTSMSAGPVRILYARNNRDSPPSAVS